MTGGSTGIGLGIIAHLLQRNASKIIMLSSREDHASEAISKLKDWGNANAIEWQQCDLADLKQTNDVAHKLKSELKQLDALVCNVGLGVGKYWETKNGLGECEQIRSKTQYSTLMHPDSHFQVNHLSQMLLTLVLMPVM